MCVMCACACARRTQPVEILKSQLHDNFILQFDERADFREFLFAGAAARISQKSVRSSIYHIQLPGSSLMRTAAPADRISQKSARSSNCSIKLSRSWLLRISTIRIGDRSLSTAYKFSKVSSLPKILHQITVELMTCFENSQPPQPHWRALPSA